MLLGLELTLNIVPTINKENPSAAEWVDGAIYVHNADVELLTEEGGIPVAPGTLTRLALEKVPGS